MECIEMDRKQAYGMVNNLVKFETQVVQRQIYETQQPLERLQLKISARIGKRNPLYSLLLRLLNFYQEDYLQDQLNDAKAIAKELKKLMSDFTSGEAPIDDPRIIQLLHRIRDREVYAHRSMRSSTQSYDTFSLPILIDPKTSVDDLLKYINSLNTDQPLPTA